MKDLDFTEEQVLSKRATNGWWRPDFREGQQPMRVLYYLLGLILLLNLMDAAFTSYWISIAGTSVELNPWLRQLLEKNFFLLYLYKITAVMVWGLVIRLWAKKVYALLYIASWLLVLVFTMINILHLAYLFIHLIR